MPLTPGTRLGTYEIVATLGEGGMGQVYRARDTKLGRDVAIKVLPDHLAGDAERVARFEREAQALAALNHPNIAQIYGTEAPSTGAGPAIVMEYVTGEDLAATLARGPLAGGEALDIARQLTLALEAAHALSIVHRDLKPANIKINADGVVKVLDFGLAKAMDPNVGRSGDADLANSPTMTSPATAFGVILGTAAYMAPEQARGRSVDKRADIWAFGCVLFEMLTGKPPFPGDNITDILAAVVTREPDWSALPSDTPRVVRVVLKKCLQKDPRLRLHDIADARLDLDAPDGDTSEVGAATALTHARVKPRWGVTALGVIAALAIGTLAGIAWSASRKTAPPEWTAARLGGPEIGMSPRVSPDGHLVAFIAMVDGQTQVAVMKPGAAAWTVVTKDRTRGLADSVAWSVDGSTIFYDRQNDIPVGIFAVPALGGDERLVIENAHAPEVLADGSLLFVRINAQRVYQLHRFWPATGKVEALPITSTNLSGRLPSARAIDASRVAIVGRVTESAAGDSLFLYDLGTGQLQPIGREVGDIIGPIAGDRTNGTVLVLTQEGSAFRVVRVWPDEKTPPETLLTLLEMASLDVGRQGEVYVSLQQRNGEIVQVDVRDGSAARVAGSSTFTRGGAQSLPDGRVLVPAVTGAGAHVLVSATGREPYPLVQSDEGTRPPMVAMADGRVALMIGAAPRDIAIVAGDSGRIIRRIKPPAEVTSITASADSKTLYFAAGGKVYAQAVDADVSRPICSGDSAIVDPATGDLIVKLGETERTRLVRCNIESGATHEIPVRGDFRLILLQLTPGSIQHNRLILPVASADSWYWFLGTIDLTSGHLEKLKVNYFTDFQYATWTRDGKALGTGLGVRSALWKFEMKARR